MRYRMFAIVLMLSMVSAMCAQESATDSPLGKIKWHGVQAAQQVAAAQESQPAPMPATERSQSLASRGIMCFGTVLDGDTIPYFHLKPVRVVQYYSLLTKEEIRKNQRLIRNVKKTMPYAKEAKYRLTQLEKELETIPASKRSAYVKQVEKEMLADFEEELMDMTVTQGKVLMKLVDRETGSSTYDIISDLRGSMRAKFYQSFARVFGVNLKKRYDPKNNKDDELLERVARSVELGKI